MKFDEVDEKVSEMIEYAKALMGADQALEALGISGETVKRGAIWDLRFPDLGVGNWEL